MYVHKSLRSDWQRKLSHDPIKVTGVLFRERKDLRRTSASSRSS